MRGATRRSFVAGGGAALAASSSTLGANDRVVLALVGAQNQGRGVARRTIQAGGVIKTLCDIDEAIIRKVTPEIEKAQGRELGSVREYRRVLEDKDIDAVVIVTPDHWHTHMALLACQAGKDVYLEKPLTQTIREGQMVRDAARKYKRVLQMGTQMRSAGHVASAMEYLASGKLGKICLIKAWTCQVRNTIGNPADCDPPSTVDYDVWLGPAPKRPFNPNRFHYNWRFFWDYGNSEIGNQGVHVLDLAMRGIQQMRGGLTNCLPGRVSSTAGIYWLKDAKEVPDMQVVNYEYGDFMLVWELRSFGRHRPLEAATSGAAFYGSEAVLVIGGRGWAVHRKDGGAGPAVKGEEEQHEKNFLDCVKSRQRPNADVEIGRLSTTLCHLGNISHHLGRDIRFDPKTETFLSDRQANALLTKQYRSSYPLPKV